MMTWKTRLLHFERMCDGLVEHFLLQHKILLLIFIGMPLVTLSAVCICSTVLVLPLALAFGYL